MVLTNEVELRRWKLPRLILNHPRPRFLSVQFPPFLILIVFNYIRGEKFNLPFRHAFIFTIGEGRGRGRIRVTDRETGNNGRRAI